MKKKSILSVLLALILVFSMTTPAMAASKPSTKTIKFNAGTYFAEESVDSEVTIKVTNVTSQKTKDFSVALSDGATKTTYSGKKSKVIYCKASTKITLNTVAFNVNLVADDKTTKYLKGNFKFYDFFPDYEGVGDTKYDAPPEGAWVVADGSSITIKKAGTYVLYVTPFQFYGNDKEDYELEPVFIVVK